MGDAWRTLVIKDVFGLFSMTIRELYELSQERVGDKTLVLSLECRRSG